MGKTDLFRALRRAARKAMAAVQLGVTPDELEARAAQVMARRTGPTRRQVLQGSLAGLAMAPLAGTLGGCGDDARAAAPIAIIGGGVAGLHAAYQLARVGVYATVYEASGRTGGRMFTTAPGTFADGQVAELGGELVDTGHTTIQALAGAFGLTLDDLHGEETQLGLASDTFHFDGAVVSDAAIVAAFMPVAMKMSEATTAAAASDAEFTRIDEMNISDWLQTEAGLGPNVLIRRLLEMAYLGEYGLEVAEQSAWNLINLIGWATPDPFAVFGDSDEAFHLRQGSQAIPDALAAQLEGQIALDHSLAAVTTRAPGSYLLTFDTAGGTRDVRVHHVIFALPFTRLRTVDLGGAALPADKTKVITELGYGSNAKLVGGFTSRAWRDHQASGTSISDVGQLQATWDTSRGQPGTSGLLTNFVGGHRGVGFGDGSAEARMGEVLPWIDMVFPGAAAAYVPNSAVRQHWPSHEFTLGSYACYKPGQTSFSGLEGARVGNLHFAGEHCSQDFQGYMEGGAETGALAALEVIDDLGLSPPPATHALMAARLALPQGSYHASGGQRLFGPRRWLRRRGR